MGARGGMIAPDETTLNTLEGESLHLRESHLIKVAYWKTLPTDEGALTRNIHLMPLT